MEALIFMGVSAVLLVIFLVVAAELKEEKVVKRSTADILNEIRRRYNVQISTYEALHGKILILDSPTSKMFYVTTDHEKIHVEVVDLTTIAGCEIEKISTLEQGVIIINKLWLRIKYNDPTQSELLILFYDRKKDSPIEGPLHHETAKKWIKMIEKYWKPILQKSA